MKKLIPLLSVLFFLICCGDSNKTQKENIPQKSKSIYEGVETMTIKRYKSIDEKFGEYFFNEEPYLIQKNTYDIKGNLIEKLYSDINGKIIDSLKSSKYMSFGKSIYEYDENNNLMISKEIKSDGTIKKIEKYIYNSKNQILNKTREDLLSDKFLKWEYSYNNFDSLEIIDYYEKPDSLKMKVKIKYDSFLKMIEWNVYNNDGSINTKTKSSYNKDNKLIKKEDYDSEGLSGISEMDYDSLGRQIKYSSSWVYKSKLQPMRGYYNKYDNNGNVIEQTNFDDEENFYEEYGMEDIGQTKEIMKYDLKNRETERLIGKLINKFGDETFQPSEKYIYEYKFY
jgi:hypothetical protein